MYAHTQTHTHTQHRDDYNTIKSDSKLSDQIYKHYDDVCVCVCVCVCCRNDILEFNMQRMAYTGDQRDICRLGCGVVERTGIDAFGFVFPTSAL